MQEYRRKIIELEESRKQQIAADIRYQERVIQREMAHREAKRLRFEREVLYLLAATRVSM